MFFFGTQEDYLIYYLIDDMHIELLNDCQLDLNRLTTYLKEVNNDFKVPLSTKNSINTIAQKLLRHGNVFIAVENNIDTAMVGFYCNDTIKKTAYFSILTCKSSYRGKGIAKKLVYQMITTCRHKGMDFIECNSTNPIAIALYSSLGFLIERKEKDIYNNIVSYLRLKL